MKQIILGTAGHIDHGKTSLIKAVTGTNTDRLKEEQERGITIELGFAGLDLPSGQHVGIVDVPGHERFVKNMVAGATGIDLVAMVIAADEGVMPQTREHMEICSLLDIQYGMVVLTKTDLVDEEWLELVRDDVEGFTQGTFLENRPVVPVSATTGEGVDEFIRTLDTLCREVPERTPAGLFRLPVDRVFTMKGFGTVITGTLIAGRVMVGDSVTIFPSGVTSKVRGIQVHNESVAEAAAGLRTAINFQGIEKSAVQRGEVVSNQDALIPSYMLDVTFRYLPSSKKPIKNRTRIRFHAGTSEILGVLILLDKDELPPGESAPAQLRLDTPVALVRGDHYVIRSYSPIRTIGGGKVLNPIPRKHKRFTPEVLAMIDGLADSPADALISVHAKAAGLQGVRFKELVLMSNLAEKKLDQALQGLTSKRRLTLTDKEQRRYLHGDILTQVRESACGVLAEYHKTFPLKAGMPKEELNSRLGPAVDTKLFTLTIGQLVKDKRIVAEEDTIRLSDHKVSLAADQTKVKHLLLEAYQDNGLQPPFFKDLVKRLDLDYDATWQVLMLLTKEGRIIKVKDELYFDAAAVDQLKQKTVAFLKAHEDMTTPQFKEIAGVSRKFLIPLIEYFDSIHVTLRVGDSRKLRKS